MSAWENSAGRNPASITAFARRKHWPAGTPWASVALASEIMCPSCRPPTEHDAASCSFPAALETKAGPSSCKPLASSWLEGVLTGHVPARAEVWSERPVRVAEPCNVSWRRLQKEGQHGPDRRQ